MTKRQRDLQRWARRGTTTQRGLGGTHPTERKRQLAALVDGVTACPFCGQPMWRTQKLDLDHWPGRAYGGPQVKRLAHRHCNRSAGASAGNRARSGRGTATWASARDW